MSMAVKQKALEIIIIEIEKFILEIKQNNLLIALVGLLSIPMVDTKILKTLEYLLTKQGATLDEEAKKNYKEKEILILQIINNYIEKESKKMLEKNPIVFRLELCKPNLHEKTCQEIIVWIHKVQIIESKLKKDNKKQFFYLIYQYQKATEIEEKQTILLNLLYKIQLYIKNAK